jgi:TonB family protein
MPHALLLSPDDQAVSAITGVLEEMSVTYERPLDGVSAAQKLNSQSFDLVLVDCENLPAAKLIFDVCRRGKNGNNPVPIAIVDGRAGLPTAFRLGAELILTKPVAKDQARSTIRSAVGRVRKDVPANESLLAHPVDTAPPTSVMTMAEDRAHAAAATASSHLTSFADTAPGIVSATFPTTATSAPPASVLTPRVHSAVDEIDTTAASPNPQLTPPSGFFSDSQLSESSATPAGSQGSKSKFPLSDDPVLAELERTEREQSEVTELLEAESQKEKSGPAKTEANQPPAESFAPVFSTPPRSQQKSRGPLVALLALALATGGFYVAWTYEPGFRDTAQTQIDRLLTLAKMAPSSSPAPDPVKPAAQPAVAAVSSPAPGGSIDASKTSSTIPDSATNSTKSLATSSPTTSSAETSPVQSPPTKSATITPSTSGTTIAAAPVAIKPETIPLAIAKPSQSKKDAVPATPPDAPLPGESNAIILSSKGAEKRLAHSVPPQYPAETRSGELQGTVVLKEVVDQNGKVEGVRLVEGNPVLATAAINAVKQWRYRPYERDGKAQPFQTVVIIDFQRP